MFYFIQKVYETTIPLIIILFNSKSINDNKDLFHLNNIYNIFLFICLFKKINHYKKFFIHLYILII